MASPDEILQRYGITPPTTPIKPPSEFLPGLTQDQVDKILGKSAATNFSTPNKLPTTPTITPAQSGLISTAASKYSGIYGG